MFLVICLVGVARSFDKRQRNKLMRSFGMTNQMFVVIPERSLARATLLQFVNLQLNSIFYSCLAVCFQRAKHSKTRILFFFLPFISGCRCARANTKHINIICTKKNYIRLMYVYVAFVCIHVRAIHSMHIAMELIYLLFIAFVMRSHSMEFCRFWDNEHKKHDMNKCRWN